MVTSPVQVTAGTTDTNKVSLVQLYVDGISKVTQNGGTLSTSVALTSGNHRLTALGKDSTGATFKQSVSVTVSAPPAACTAGPVSPSVAICAPVANATLASPMRVVAAAVSPRPVATMEVYVDGIKVTQKAASSIDTSIVLAKGTHRLTVLAVDNTLATSKQSLNITVQ